MKSLTKILIGSWLASICSYSAAAVLAKEKLWPQNQTLNVVFLDGEPSQKSRVKTIAPQWVEGIQLQFRFFESLKTAPNKTHIRISFDKETGSMLGDHGDYHSQSPTLLLNELNTILLESDLAARYILHEFGHALGFEHEFRNPNWPYGEAPIKLLIEKCVPRLSKIDYSLAEASEKCRELNQPLSKENSFSTVYDKHSIMNYPQSITLKDHSKVIIAAKTKLSALDRLAMERWYGKSN